MRDGSRSESVLKGLAVVGTTYGRVEIVAYQLSWPECFSREEIILRDALGEDVIEIEHVGSTSIDGMDAKPTIDILVGVSELTNADYYLDKLAGAGYEFRPSHPVPGRLHFAKIDDGLRTHNLSVTVHRSEFWQTHILFRDYLRDHPCAVAAYARLKQELARKYPDDTIRYTEGKNQFIEAILQKSTVGVAPPDSPKHSRTWRGITVMPTSTIALFGAAGKIGMRIADSLRDDAECNMLYVEAGEAGLARLRERGLTPTSQEEAVQEADTIVLAIPDTLIGSVSSQVVPKLKTGTLVVLLDPAAPHGGELPDRADIAYFVVHPCHPPLINDEVDPDARDDFWGGKAKQNIVCAVMQGSDDDYIKGESLARKMFAPVMNSHRITVEQMAILEPTMAETMILTCQVVIKEAIEEAIERGVPRQVAYDFAMGHMRVNLGILFGFIDAEVSDGAKLAVKRAKEHVFQPGWKRVFEPENVMAEVEAIVRGRGRRGSRKGAGTCGNAD